MAEGVTRIMLGSQGLEVSEQRLGCMGMSAFYGPPKSEDDVITLIHHAISSGITFRDTSDVYAPHTNEILLAKNLPRFQPESMEHNKRIFEWVSEIAAQKGCTLAQLALTWVHCQGEDVCPIPGNTKIENLNQNIRALSVKLASEEIAELESLVSAQGDGYGGILTTWMESVLGK